MPKLKVEMQVEFALDVYCSRCGEALSFKISRIINGKAPEIYVEPGHACSEKEPLEDEKV